MSETLSHKERIERILNGKEIDRVPVSAWRHFYDRENSKDDLVKSMLGFQREFDWDFIKINSRASYHVEDWGARFDYSPDPLARPAGVEFPVKKSSDWGKIKPLDFKAGSLGEILNAGKEILAQAGSEVYCVPTIFSPLSIAADMVESEENFLSLLESAPTDLHGALEAITMTFERYVREFITMGMAGIFFATTEWASRDRITEEQYLEFGRPYDLRVLKAASEGFFNITHVCKTNNMLPLFKDYPSEVLSWNPFETGNLQLGQAAQITEKIFMSGIDQNNTLLNGPLERIREQVEDSLGEVAFGRLIAAPGCAIRVQTPDENLQTFSDSVRGWKP